MLKGFLGAQSCGSWNLNSCTKPGYSKKTPSVKEELETIVHVSCDRAKSCAICLTSCLGKNKPIGAVKIQDPYHIN